VKIGVCIVVFMVFIMMVCLVQQLTLGESTEPSHNPA
jgi:hypothetical protein